ncbi:hypothetical protein BCR44DRAFT_1026894 [Catenaria anguillulae PL171]|uniref:LUC7-domain-containing protein n=1 Tax=Catenaria anguillulae PL171 TaxID=765915 RepID=A0A1Y2HTC9_9FUNG|nr:hypothetical protein BCR44DRAFT_1026894 [Catenaria anguillulae PL171]
MADWMRDMISKMMSEQGLDQGTLTEVQFDDPKVCRGFLEDVCLAELFVNTKLDQGECKNMHSIKLKDEYQAAHTDKGHGHPGVNRVMNDLERELAALVSDCDRRIRIANDRVAATQASRNLINLRQAIAEMEQKLTDLDKESDQLASDGKVEEMMAVVTQIEDIKKEKSEKEAELKNMIGHDSTAEQGMCVCDICGALLASEDATDRRVADHFTGKMHIGYDKVRTALRSLRDRLRQRPGAPLSRASSTSITTPATSHAPHPATGPRSTSSHSGSVHRDRSSGPMGAARSAPRSRSRSRSRDRGPRREWADRDRDRDRDREYRRDYRDRDRDRDREYYRSSRYRSRSRDRRDRHRDRDGGSRDGYSSSSSSRRNERGSSASLPNAAPAVATGEVDGAVAAPSTGDAMDITPTTTAEASAAPRSRSRDPRSSSDAYYPDYPRGGGGGGGPSNGDHYYSGSNSSRRRSRSPRDRGGDSYYGSGGSYRDRDHHHQYSVRDRERDRDSRDYRRGEREGSSGRGAVSAEYINMTRPMNDLVAAHAVERNLLSAVVSGTAPAGRRASTSGGVMSPGARGEGDKEEGEL